MSNFIKHIDDFFREKLGNYRETPPPEAWDEIEARLDGLKPAGYGASYRWMMHFALVSLILFLSVSVGKKFFGNANAENKSIALNDNLSTNLPLSNSQNPESKTASDATVNNGNVPGNPAGQSTMTNPGKEDNNGTSSNTVTIANKETNKGTTGKKSAGTKHLNAPIAGNTTQNKSKDNKENNTHHYNGNLSKPAPEEEGDDNNLVIAASPNTTLSVVSKPEVQANATKKEAPVHKPSASIADKNSNTRNKPSFPRFEAGVKAGYEGGFNDGAAKKFAIAPYAQYNLSPKFSVMLQPGIIASNINGRTLGTPETYYNANPENMVMTHTKMQDQIYTSGSETIVDHVDNYHYTQSHDSILKTSRIGGTTMEFELPVLLKYNISKKFSGYGGINIVYSKLTTIRENTYTQKGIIRSFDTTVISPDDPATTKPQGIGFTYSGSPVSDYNGPLHATQSGYQFNVAYMVGFTYALGKKWLIDALIKRTYVPADIKGGYNINTSQSSTYFRLSIGYKITK